MGPEQFRLHAELEKEHWWFTGRRRIVRELVKRILPREQGGTVVDVGCGTGANIAALADQYDAIGIDPSHEAISYARECYPHVRFLCGSAPDDLGAIVGEADLFLLMDVIEHVLDDRRLLANLLAGSRPGAQILVTVPADMSLWSVHDVAFGHYRRYNIPVLRQLWAGFPVSVRMLSFFNTRLYPVVKTIRTVTRWTGRAAGRSGTDLSSLPRALNRVLHSVFAGEARRLVHCLEQKQSCNHRYGVSLIAVLRREPGDIRLQAVMDGTSRTTISL